MPTEVLWNGITMENPAEQFRLGTDSVILADFASPKPHTKVADLGCGTGAICLMLLASEPTLSVTGIELQEDFFRVAEENKRKNNLSSLQFLLGDVRQMETLLPANGFQLVVSNPPYFPANGLLSKDARLAAARSEQFLSPKELCRAAAWILDSGGRFCLVHRPERLADLICALRENRLEPKRMQFVRHSADSRRSLVLLEAVLDGKPQLDCLDDLILYLPDGTASEACRRAYHQSEEA